MSKTFDRVVLGVSAAVGLAAGVLVPPQEPVAVPFAQERHAAALAVWTQLEAQPWHGLAECDTRATWSRQLAEAAVDSGVAKPRDAFAQHLARMAAMLEATKLLREASRATSTDVAAVEFHVAAAKALAQR